MTNTLFYDKRRIERNWNIFWSLQWKKFRTRSYNREISWSDATACMINEPVPAYLMPRTQPFNSRSVSRWYVCCVQVYVYAHVASSRSIYKNPSACRRWIVLDGDNLRIFHVAGRLADMEYYFVMYSYSLFYAQRNSIRRFARNIESKNFLLNYINDSQVVLNNCANRIVKIGKER